MEKQVIQPDVEQLYNKNLRHYRDSHSISFKNKIMSFLQSSPRPARNIAVITLGTSALILIAMYAYKQKSFKRY